MMRGVSAYDVGPADFTYYPSQTTDPVRSFNPYGPVTNSQAIASGAPQVPVWGLLVVVGVIVLFEHFRRGR